MYYGTTQPDEMMMETPIRRKISIFTPEQLLGPLNDVEKKYAAPKLFVSGSMKIPVPKPRVAIIGSRKASERGLSVAQKIASVLVENRVVIVSGLAEGIDTAAHSTAIEHGGATIAILGTPLDRAYPRKNSSLQDEIAKNHLAVSQFPIGHPVRPSNFVLRNRTMALVANASVIVEAGESSGSLHQGWEALRLGRPLFIWTSIVKNPLLKWPGEMIRYGALELISPMQIMEVLPSPGKILIKIVR